MIFIGILTELTRSRTTPLTPICVFGYKFTPDTCPGVLPPDHNKVTRPVSKLGLIFFLPPGRNKLTRRLSKVDLNKMFTA